MELVQRRGPIDSRGEVQRVCHGPPAYSHGPSAYKTSRKLLIVRIGINLGDIIIDGDDIYGDGVNVAAPPRPVGPATKPSKTWRWPATAPVAGLKTSPKRPLSPAAL